MLIKIILLAVFFSVLIAVGLKTRKKADSVSKFVLGGRSIGPWMTAFSYGTAYFSAVIFVGYAGQFGFKYGLASTWVGLGNALIGSLLAWAILGRRTRVMSNHLQASTMPEFFGKRYDSKRLKIAASIIVFIFLVPYTASIYNGLSRLFEMAFGIPYIWCVLAMAALTALYVVLGGYMATAVTDFVQGCIMLLGIVVVVASVLAEQGGFAQALVQLAQVPPDSAAPIAQQGAYTSFFGPDPLNLLGVIILTSLGAWGLPQMVHKFYAIKSEKAVYAGTVISTVFALVVAGGSYFLGGFARLYDSPAIHQADGSVIYDAIIPSMLAGLPDLVIGLVVVLVLSASMSTLASLVLTSSSTITLDLIRDNRKGGLSERAQMRWLRGLLVFFIAVSVILALDPPTFIAQLMGISWGALAGSFLAPFIFGLYWKRVTRTAVWASFASGVGITVSNMLLHYIASPINAGAIAMLAGLAIVPLVSLLGKKPEQAHIDGIFNCYEEKVLVARKYHLKNHDE
ncbi:MAG: sodium/solute symporter [Bacillota bacterium]|nr:sodium/solute symporter [Bacillota bacterium]